MKKTDIPLVLGQRYRASNGLIIVLTQRVSTHGKYKYLGRYYVSGDPKNRLQSVPGKWMGGDGGREHKGQNGWDLIKLVAWPRVEKNVYGHFSNIALMKSIAKLLHAQGVRQVDIAKVLGAGTGSVNLWLKGGNNG